jgi:DNA-directed RNA polymerase subunit RPC12/RpoP
MPRFYRQRHGFGHRGRPFMGALWMIGLGFLMLTGHWWPGILVLVGLSMVLGALTKEDQPSVLDEPEKPGFPPAAPAPVQPREPEPFQFQPAIPVEPSHRADLLPANCSQCGGPMRASEVKWHGPKSASCPYCGSTLKMKPG